MRVGWRGGQSDLLAPQKERIASPCSYSRGLNLTARNPMHFTGTGLLGRQFIMAARTEEKSVAPLEVERDVEGAQQQGKTGGIEGKE